MDYQKNIELIKTYPKTQQLIRTNFYLNQLLPQYDDVIQKQEDYWSTPKEFLITGYGDCEDYAIIKYYSLIKLGFDEKKLFITTVHEKYSGGYHMVLSYFQNPNRSPLILDNLSFKVLDLKTRKDLQADLFINSTGVYKLSKKNILIKIADSLVKYKNLVEKIKKEN
jgi:predicted transglutaminase-like cysteine proteinase